MTACPLAVIWARNDYYFFDKDILLRELGRTGFFSVQAMKRILEDAYMGHGEDSPAVLLGHIVDDIRGLSGGDGGDNSGFFLFYTAAQWEGHFETKLQAIAERVRDLSDKIHAFDESSRGALASEDAPHMIRTQS